MLDWTKYLNYLDLILLPFYLGAMLFMAARIQKKYIDENPIYRFYTLGLFVRIFGGIAFSLIYIFYYKGGDTTSYFEGARALCRLFLKEPSVSISMLMGNNSDENWSYFDYNTGWPVLSMYKNSPDSWAVSRFSSIFLFISFNSFLVGISVLNYFLYKFIWKFFLMFNEIYPNMERQLAFAILFVPSVAFWGSGFMKDTYTFVAALYFTYNIYMLFIKKQKIRLNIIAIIINSIIMITLKPYVLVALLPATLLWITYNRVHTIQNQTIRIFTTPFLLTLGIGISVLLFSLLGGSLGSYGSVETIVKKAQITQQDLIRSEQYGENYFDIGKFDASIGGILGKAPVAITAGLFRPFVWEAGSIVMLLSGIENAILLFMTIYVFFRVGPFKTIGHISREPLLLFSVVFALVMAFSCGLTAANFGALARYKIPAIPFYVAALFILYGKSIRPKVLI